MPQVGDWHIETDTQRFTSSLQMHEFYGYHSGEQMSYNDFLAQITEEYRDKISATINHAVSNREHYTVEYPITRVHDQKVKWLRAHGKYFLEEGDMNARHCSTLWDITERKEFEQRKDDFISIASHELKTPVTSLKAALQLLDKIKYENSTPLMIKLIEQSNKSLDKITNLIDELLNVSRMNEGQMNLNKTVFTLSNMLDNCCSHVRVEGKHDLVLTGDAILQVTADEDRIEQVVVNLVNNAVKYAPECREIYLSVEKENDMAKVSVTDHGKGIPEDKLPHLFDRYFRVSHATHQPGLGLGLFISYEIIQRHGGIMGVTSELGKGSTFWFTLPLSQLTPTMQ